MKNTGAILFSLTFAACILVLLISCAKKVELAKTPPVDWNSWNRFGCNVDEKMIMEMADAMVSKGGINAEEKVCC